MSASLTCGSDAIPVLLRPCSPHRFASPSRRKLVSHAVHQFVAALLVLSGEAVQSVAASNDLDDSETDTAIPDDDVDILPRELRGLEHPWAPV